MPRKNGCKGILAVVIAAAMIMICAIQVSKAQSTTRYVYDDNGRLRAVIAPNGEATIYEYDPAGNIAAIRRNTSSTLEAIDFSPHEGVPSTQVTIVGTGFGNGVSAVQFNGTAAQIVSVNAPIIIVAVPEGATSGLITVTTPQGTTSTAQPFIIRGIRLTPPSASLNPARTVQFTAQVYPLETSQNVKWSVNRLEGGNSAIGMISAAGLYTAPVYPFAPAMIRAVSVENPSIFEEAQVSLLYIPPRAAPASAALSVKRAPDTVAVTTAAPAAAAISVRRDIPANPTVVAPVGAGVSVRRDTPSGIATVVSAISSASATAGPYISAITPNTIARDTTITIAISGANLEGASSLVFIDNNGVNDATITFSNMTVSVGGSSLMANVTTTNATALGQRLVVVMTATNRSLSVGTGSNTIQIVP